MTSLAAGLRHSKNVKTKKTSRKVYLQYLTGWQWLSMSLWLLAWFKHVRKRFDIIHNCECLVCFHRVSGLTVNEWLWL